MRRAADKPPKLPTESTMNASQRAEELPEVEILIPTFNRENTLRRTIASAKAQSYPHITITVSNNGSTDGTTVLLREMDVRHYNHSHNIGGLRNFDFLWSLSRAPFRMFLADDDWISGNYIEECIKPMISDPNYSVVGGLGMHYNENVCISKDSCYNLSSLNPLSRLKVFCNSITTSNDIFYGLRRLDSYSQRLAAMSDWADTYHSIAKGKVAAISSANIHRDFKNWHPSRKQSSHERFLYKSHTIGGEHIIFHPILAFFTIAESIKVSEQLMPDIAYMLASIITPPAWQQHIFSLLRALHARGGTPLQDLIKAMAEPLDTSFMASLYTVVKIISDFKPISSYELKKELSKLKRILNATPKEVIDLVGLWNECIVNPSAKAIEALSTHVTLVRL